MIYVPLDLDQTRSLRSLMSMTKKTEDHIEDIFDEDIRLYDKDQLAITLVDIDSSMGDTNGLYLSYESIVMTTLIIESLLEYEKDNDSLIQQFTPIYKILKDIADNLGGIN